MKSRKLAGVWIDSSRAVIATLNGNDQDLSILTSDIEGVERIEGEGRPEGRFGGQFIAHEKAKDARRDDSEARFSLDVAEKVRDADQLLIFGPAHMKDKLASTVRSLPQPVPNIRAVETADSMTDNQVAAYVREFFGRSGMAA
ncbi:MAG: hypothetical protein AB7J13_00585 [Pyrinomonadaceae bacterium]